jgi:hypothetical protein
MQLDALVLYNSSGEPRTLRFQSGKLNIITGDSRTGKSSLINIIRFCLGAGSPQVPFGQIRNTTVWYGLLAHVADTSFFIGRPAPRGDATTNATMLIVGASSIPGFSELQANTTAEALRRYLAGLIGIQENLNVPGVGQSRRALAAGFVHSLHYCFQGQGEIANPEVLFHRQNREFQPQTIRDTFPYFLGAQGADELRMRQELLDLRRLLRVSERTLQGAIAEREVGLDRSAALLSEAREVGLSVESELPNSLLDMREVLRSLLTAQSSLQAGESGGEFERLSASRRQPAA